MHAGHKPDDAQERAENARRPALLHLGKHKQVHRSAQQRAADGHIESQHRVRCEEDAAHKSEHQKERRKNTDCDEVLYSQAFFIDRLHNKVSFAMTDGLTFEPSFDIVWLELINRN